MGLQPPPNKKELAIRGDLLLVKGPQKLSEKRVSAGVEVGGVGQHVDMLFVGGPLCEQGALHVLTGGGWKTMVAGGVDHDENLPLIKEALVAPLHLGLPQGCSRLNGQAVLGGHGRGNPSVLGANYPPN